MYSTFVAARVTWYWDAENLQENVAPVPRGQEFDFLLLYFGDVEGNWAFCFDVLDDDLPTLTDEKDDHDRETGFRSVHCDPSHR